MHVDLDAGLSCNRRVGCVCDANGVRPATDQYRRGGLTVTGDHPRRAVIVAGHAGFAVAGNGAV